MTAALPFALLAALATVGALLLAEAINRLLDRRQNRREANDGAGPMPPAGKR